MKTLVSLVTHDECRDVERLLPTIAAQTERGFEIHAVDNASEDGSRAALAAFQKIAPVPMRIDASRANLGYTGGHNRAIERAAAEGFEFVLLLNADLRLDPTFLERLLEDAADPGHERVGSFTAKVLRAEGEDLLPTRIVDTVGIRMTREGRHFDVGAGAPDDGRWDRPAEVFGVSGCAALFRVAALRDVRIDTGFLDDDYFVYREDVDLAWRLRGRGWTARCVPSARAWHRRRNLPERRRVMSPLANMHSVKNRFLLRINNAGTRHLAATFPRTFARDVAVVGACLTVERSSLWALRWLAGNRERLLAKRAAIQSSRTVSDADLLRWFSDDPDGGRLPDPA